jgi:hypothetical protein
MFKAESEELKRISGTNNDVFLQNYEKKVKVSPLKSQKPN